RSAREAGRGAFLSDAVTGGFTPTVQTEVRVEAADERTAAALDLQPGDEVLVRDRVMSADGTPVQLATSWLPRSITAGTQLEEVDTGTSGSYGLLDALGHPLAHGVEYVRARPADTTEAERLAIQPGAPVIDVTRIVHDEAGTPVETTRMIMNAERYELAYDVQVN
ncbi:GntR family transcriptional regulator, partial [Actinosynnema sp.]|uniref:GntR family transcriptional regulator n=1 Tax=Actinosynnema sp. TaxID=1872144 RepID=UPI003F8485A9